MFGIGFPELVVIVLAVIIFLKPEDLPAFFRMAGKTYVKIKKALDELGAIKNDFMKVVDESAKEGEAKPTSTGPATYASVQKAAAAADVPGSSAQASGSESPAPGSVSNPETLLTSEASAFSARAATGSEISSASAVSPAQDAMIGSTAGTAAGVVSAGSSASSLPEPYAAAYQERLTGASEGFDPDTPAGRPSGPGSAGLPPRRPLGQSPDDLVEDILLGPSSRPSGMGSAALPPRKDTPSES